MPRTLVLRRAAAQVRPGGTLLVVNHASAPPCSWAAPDTVFPSPADTWADIGLAADECTVVRLDAAARQSTGPDGEQATVTDNIFVLRRRGRA